MDTDIDKNAETLRRAVDYVVGFNMKGLHRIENDLFFPWVRLHLRAIDDAKVANAFESIIDMLESEQQQIVQLSESLQSESLADSESIGNVASTSSMMADCVESMRRKEDGFLVPALARLVTESEQKKFNNKVIARLGILDSRLHLVGMHEAVSEQSQAEQELFDQVIPYIPRLLIPRWKRTLYEPVAAALDAS